MTRIAPVSALMAALCGLSACDEGVRPYVKGPNTVIATDHDSGNDNSGLSEADAAVVYDPDGCQGWIIDNGVEGYSGRRYDPVTGLPVCDAKYPPGTVVGNFRASSPDIPDFVPRP